MPTQTLDVISVNLWQIVISLINLALLFFMLKRFLFKPVKNILIKRQSEIDGQYADAELAQNEAEENRRQWQKKLSGAESEADAIVQRATDNAKYRGEKLIADAEKKAESIIRIAKTEAELEKKKATEAIKREIVEVSGALAEKMLEREINNEDHRILIDSFIEKVGELNE